MHLLRLAIAGLLAAGTGCMSPPEQSFPTPLGVVRAPTREEAEVLARRYESERRALAALLPDTREESVDVWVQRELRPTAFLKSPEGARGLTVHRKGKAPRIHVLEGTSNHTLSHEIVHALLGPSWSVLPQAVEEGLCDVLADQRWDTPAVAVERIGAALSVDAQTYTLWWEVFVGEERLGWGSSHWTTGFGSRSLEVRLTLDPETARSEPPPEPEPVSVELDSALTLPGDAAFFSLEGPRLRHLYGVGFVLAQRLLERIGIEGLHELCLRAQAEDHETIPPDWLLAAAELEDPEQFRAAAREAWLAASYRELLASTHLAKFLEERIEELEPNHRQQTEPLAWEELAHTFSITLRINDEPPIALEDLPGFDAWRASTWPAIATPP